MSSGRIVGINGQLVSEEAARISIFDHGFLYGAGFFATVRWEQDRVFSWEWHLERLERSCASLGIKWTAADGLLAHVSNVCKANGLFQQAYVRISVSAGEAPLGLYTGIYQAPQIIVIAQALPESLLKPIQERAPKSLQAVNIPRAGIEGEERFKSFQYLNLLYGKRALAQTGVTGTEVEGLMFDAHGSICEGLVSNVFFRKGESWFTPALSTGCLPGVTRRWAIQYFRDQGVSIQEGHFAWTKLVEADDVFVCNSIQQLAPIRHYYDQTGKLLRTWEMPSPVLQDMMIAFEAANRKAI